MNNEKSLLKRAEGFLESIIFASRWLLAPFYLGLALSLFVLLIKFVGELGHIAAHAFTATESEVILGVLALVDLSLTGSLLVIVIFSGYENFVSRIDHGDHKDWPEWMGKIDFSALKLKLLSSIVAISAIQLLKQFMSINKVSDRDIMWLVIVHVVFVVSSVLLALSDRIAVHGNHGHGSGNDGNGGGGGGSHGTDATHAHGTMGQSQAASHAAHANANANANAGRTMSPHEHTNANTAAADPGSGAAAPVRTPTEPAPRAAGVRVTRVEVKRQAKAQPAEDDGLLPGELSPAAKRKLN